MMIRDCMAVDCMAVFFAWIVVERINSRSVWSTFPAQNKKKKVIVVCICVFNVIFEMSMVD